MNWIKEHTFLSGGLIALGFSSDSKALFAVTHSGRGIFDIQKQERIARDYDDCGSWYHNDQIDGFSTYSEEKIAIFGLDSPTPNSVMEELRDFDLESQVTEFKGASISPNEEFLAVGFSDSIVIYKKKPNKSAHTTSAIAPR